MIRDLDYFYDTIYCDIDNTIIYGFTNDLMDIIWKYTHSDFIADILMSLQAKFKLYKVNHKLVYLLNVSKKPIVFLTARKEHTATYRILERLIPNYAKLVSLRTDNPHKDKIQYILNNQMCDSENFCIFDDNDKVREEAMAVDIDAFDPRPLYERMVK